MYMQNRKGLGPDVEWQLPGNPAFIGRAPGRYHFVAALDAEQIRQPEVHQHRVSIQVVKHRPIRKQGLFPALLAAAIQHPEPHPSGNPGIKNGPVAHQGGDRQIVAAQ